MIKIRVARPFGSHESQIGEPIGDGVWFPDTPENRVNLTIVFESGTRGVRA